MRLKLSAFALSLAALGASHAVAGTIPYPNFGTPNPVTYTFTATATGDRAEGAVDFDVATGRAILAACPVLRTLNCRLGYGAEDAGNGTARLRELRAFLCHPAVRCEHAES